MNEIIKGLYERRSVRAFLDKEIPAEIEAEIITAATMAPTAGNQQLYSIIKVTDESLKAALAKSCDNQPFIKDAKLLLIFAADCLKWYDAFRYAGCEPRVPEASDLLLAIDDALIAAQNAVVAAESYGIGSCYIGDIMEACEEHREMLGLPELVFPAAMVVFGYPSESQINRKKPRRADEKYIVFENRYHRLSEGELQDMLSPRAEAREYRDYMRAFCERKYNSDFSREMARSVKEYLKQYGE